jgi:hypothetical protein
MPTRIQNQKPYSYKMHESQISSSSSIFNSSSSAANVLIEEKFFFFFFFQPASLEEGINPACIISSSSSCKCMIHDEPHPSQLLLYYYSVCWSPRLQILKILFILQNGLRTAPCNRQQEQQQELGIVSKFLHTAIAHIGAGAVVIF